MKYKDVWRSGNAILKKVRAMKYAACPGKRVVLVEVHTVHVGKEIFGLGETRLLHF